MVVLSMGDMLKRLGWTDGFHIPISNEVNRGLENEVMHLTLRRAKTTVAYDLAKSKFEGLHKHLKFLQLESGQNQILLNEFTRQIDAEKHQYHINKGHKEKMNQEIRQIRKEIADIEDRQVLRKVDLTRSLLKMELMKSEATWDTEALIGWDDALRKRDGDNELLIKFAEEDDRIMKELESRRQMLCLEVINRKKLIEKMVAECLNYEQVLDKTGKLFKKQTIEQRALMKRWQDSIGVLRQRDEDLQDVELQIDSAGEALLIQQELVEEQNTFLKNERTNNSSIEEETANLNQQNSRARRDLNQIIDYIAMLTNDHGTVQRLLSNTGHQLEKERVKRKQLDLDAEQRKRHIDAIQCELVELKLRSNEVSSSSMSSADRVKRLEGIIDHQNRLEMNLDIDVTRIQGILYRSQQILRELRDSYRIIEAEVRGCQLSITLMHRRAEIERTEKEKQEAAVYELEFRMDRLNSRLEHMEGVIKDSEGSELMQNRITGLEQKITREKDIRTQLQNQVTRLSDEMRRLTSAIAADAATYHELQGKLVDNKLLYEGGLKMVQAAKQRTQQRQVDENIFRLRVSQLNKCISREDNNIYNLNRLKIDLETAMQARKLEIQAHRDIVLAQRNTLAEEISRLRMDISSRGIRLEQFNSKHHIALMSLGHGDGGDVLSITHIKVRNSQQKYELEQRGDELDSKINKMESEIVAMENTLKVVNMTNQRFKSSLTTIEENDDEAREMRQFQKQINEGILNLKEVNNLLAQKQEYMYDLQDSCNEFLIQRTHLIDVLSNLKNESNKYEIEDAARAEKIHRTNRQIKMNKNNIPNQLKMKYNKDLYIRQMQDANKTAFHKLVDIGDRYADLAPLLTDYIAAEGLSLPKPRSRLSHSDSNATSDSVVTPNNPPSSRNSSNEATTCSTGSSSSAIHNVFLQNTSTISEIESIATNNVLKFDESTILSGHSHPQTLRRGSLVHRNPFAPRSNSLKKRAKIKDGKSNH